MERTRHPLFQWISMFFYLNSPLKRNSIFLSVKIEKSTCTLVSCTEIVMLISRLMSLLCCLCIEIELKTHICEDSEIYNSPIPMILCNLICKWCWCGTCAGQIYNSPGLQPDAADSGQPRPDAEHAASSLHAVHDEKHGREPRSRFSGEILHLVLSSLTMWTTWCLYWVFFPAQRSKTIKHCIIKKSQQLGRHMAKGSISKLWLFVRISALGKLRALFPLVASACLNNASFPRYLWPFCQKWQNGLCREKR